MKIIAIIPARLAATRFPNKPMAKIKGMPMIGHCYIRSKLCSLLDETYVATCDQEIKDYIDRSDRTHQCNQRTGCDIEYRWSGWFIYRTV